MTKGRSVDNEYTIGVHGASSGLPFARSAASPTPTCSSCSAWMMVGSITQLSTVDMAGLADTAHRYTPLAYTQDKRAGFIWCVLDKNMAYMLRLPLTGAYCGEEMKVTKTACTASSMYKVAAVQSIMNASPNLKSMPLAL